LARCFLPGEDRHAVTLGTADGDVPRIEIHAHTLARLLKSWQPKPLLAASKPLILLAAAVIGVFLVGLRISGRLRAALSAGVVAAAVAVVLLLARVEVMTPVVGPVETALITMAVTRLPIAGLERARHRFLHRAFGNCIPPALVDRLVAHPADLQLSGERRTITALFIDLEGINRALTEAVPPQTLVALLNAHLDGICRIVVKQAGTIDKLVGDVVVALFNALVDIPNLATRAVRSALAIDAFVSGFARA